MENGLSDILTETGEEYQNEKEVWKDISGYEGLYQVSNYGRILSLKFNHKENNARVLKPIYVRGYLCVNLYKNKIIKMAKIHRLVAEAFIPNPKKLPEINHKSENKTENYVGNLEWCDSKYNNNYGTKVKRAIETKNVLYGKTEEEKKLRKRETANKWRANNSERLKSYMKEYRKKESYKKKVQEYNATHREKINERARINYWRRKNGENKVQTTFA